MVEMICPTFTYKPLMALLSLFLCERVALRNQEKTCKMYNPPIKVCNSCYTSMWDTNHAAKHPSPLHLYKFHSSWVPSALEVVFFVCSHIFPHLKNSVVGFMFCLYFIMSIWEEWYHCKYGFPFLPSVQICK